jgi:hypothetical protein
MPVIDKVRLPPRAQTLAQIESGELDHIDFTARVYSPAAKNRNPYEFPADSMLAFASSFEGAPFLRNHDTQDIGARDGTIIEAALNGAGQFEQTIRLTTRRGMTAFVEGQIDRFSIGWYYDDVTCTICSNSFFSPSCSHWPGREYETAQGKKIARLMFVNPVGKETSAVNAPAVEGTGIDTQLTTPRVFVQTWADELATYKLSINGAANPEPHAATVRPASPRSLKGASTMTPTIGGQETPAANIPAHLAGTLEAIEANRNTAAEIAAEAEAQQQTLTQQLAESQAVLIAQCAHLLDTGLAASHLPEPTQSRIRKAFEGKAFQPAMLSQAINDAKAEISAIMGAGMVQGPGRVSGVFNTGDQFTAALFDLLGAPRDSGTEGLKVARLSGIREAYLLATGDRDFVGGFFPDFALDSANFPVVVKNALNKRLAQAWANYGKAGYDWWSRIVSVEHFETLQQVDWLITGTIGTLPSIEERAEYTELPIGDNGETSDWTKYGGYVGLTLESILRDDVRAFRRLPDEVAMGGLRNVSEQVAAIFTSNSAVGPTLSDTGALFNATAVTTKGGHANLLTTALGTTLTAWRAVEAAMYSQPMHIKNETGYYGTGKPQAIRPKYLLVPIDLSGAADDLFLPNLIATGGSNIMKGVVENIVVPEWTDATDWAAVADPNVLPGIMLGEMFGVMPQIFLAGKESDPAFFANDESRIKVRQFLTVGIANWRALHKSNVAG